jgi:ABC-type transport system involved in multi-copper enzyme maturation permease subunit
MIFHLLILEWKKFKGNAVVQLLVAMFLLLMPSIIFFGKEITNLPAMLPNNSIFFNFPTVWEYQGYVGNWLVFFFLGFIAVFMVTSEVANKTMRQSIIIGMTRKQFFLGKLSAITVLALLATLVYTISTFLIGAFHAESFSFADAMDNNWAIGRFFLMSMGYLGFGLMLGFVIRNSGIATLLYISYVMFIELILRWWLHYYVMDIQNNSVNYYPMNAVEDLMPNPFYKYAELLPRQDLDFNFLLTLEQATVTSAIYLVIFIGLAWWHFKTKDI